MLAAFAVPVSIGTTQAASGGILAKLLVFFLKAGSLTFGSGLVIVPFLEKGLVQDMGWIDPHQFLVAVAIGMLSPGPVVITATFVGYLVAGFWGSLVSTIGIFLPSFLLILIAAPILRRHRGNAERAGLHQGRLRRGDRHHPRRLRSAWPHRDRRLADSADRRWKPGRTVPVQGEQSDARRGDRGDRFDRLPDPATRVGVRAVNQHDDATHRSLRSNPMRYKIAPLFCRPWTLNGISPRLIESHYENDYGNALDRLNAITEELEALDPATTPGHVIGRLKRDEATALNATLLHELYFASLGGDGRTLPEEMANAIAGDFGSVNRWRQEFIALANGLAGGSGWVVLSYVPRDGRLINLVAAGHDQNLAGGIPILALDMYEHAYHLEFGANATAYIAAFMRNIDWDAVLKRYRNATKVEPPPRLEQKQFPDLPSISVEEVRSMLDAGNPCRSSTRARGTTAPEHRTSWKAQRGGIPSAWTNGSANCRRAILSSPSAFTVSTSAARPPRHCARPGSTHATWPAATMRGRRSKGP